MHYPSDKVRMKEVKGFSKNIITISNKAKEPCKLNKSFESINTNDFTHDQNTSEIKKLTQNISTELNKFTEKIKHSQKK